MSSPRQPADNLRRLLDEAESDLSRRLREACDAEARGVATDSAAEIRQLEDSLLSAALAAERMLAARRHLDADGSESRPKPEGKLERSSRPDAAKTPRAPASPSPSDRGSESRMAGDPPSPVSTAVREFTDNSGRSWRAWPVTPGMAHPNQTSRRALGDFQEGWICFEALDNSGRRRLPRHDPRWSDLQADELQQLLDQAIDAPGRKLRRSPDQTPSTDGGGLN